MERKEFRLLLTAGLAFGLSLATAAVAQNWPSFRGPHARGVADGQDLPVTWDVQTSQNVVWKQDIPGVAHSSPVVWGDHLFVTTAVSDQAGDLKLGDTGGIDLASDPVPFSWQVLALDKETGKTIWETRVVEGKPRAKRHVKSSQANATPVTNGDVVAAILGSEGLFVLDSKTGEIQWKKDLGVLDPGLFGDTSSQWGHASSPVIWRDRVIVQVDRHEKSFLAAYDLKNGKELWKIDRRQRPVWATPTIHEGETRTELIVIGGEEVKGFDPETGKELWSFRDEAEVKTPTPFVAGDKVIVSGGYRGRPIYALKLGASGDLSVPEGQDSGGGLVWRTDRGGPYTSTPVVYGKHVYAVTDKGVLGVYDLETGERLHRERSDDSYSASPVASDGKIYFTGENGSVTVVQAGPELEVLATQDMGEPCMGTPAISDGTLYFRCRDHVFAVAKVETPRPETSKKPEDAQGAD